MDYRHDTENTILKIKSQRIWGSSSVTAWGTVFLVVTFLVYLMFGVVEVGTARPAWFKFSTHLFSGLALIGTIVLCWRNSLQAHIPSGKKVWRLFSWAAIAVLAGQIGEVIWEFYLGWKVGGSPADLCFVAFYLLTIWGLGLVVIHQKISLDWRKMVVVVLVGIMASSIVWQLLSGVTMTEPAAAVPVGWLAPIAQSLQPLADAFGLFYLLADVVLIVMASILFLGFWGGRLGTTWQVIAMGLACVYLADVRFAYLTKIGAYERGDLMELFWLAGFVQFSIAAALEGENAYRVQRLLQR
jgi:hypothetical protein